MASAMAWAYVLRPAAACHASRKRRDDFVENGVNGSVAIFKVFLRAAGDNVEQARGIEPRGGSRVVGFGNGKHQVAFDFVDAQLREISENRKEAGSVTGHGRVGGSEDESLVAFVGATIEKIGSFGVRARDDDARNAHDVELEARGIEALDLFVFADENLAALMAALFHAGFLVFDVVAGHADFDKPADEIANVCVAAMARVSVSDYERTKVNGRRGCALLCRHARTRVALILVRGEQSADDGGGFVGNLAERVAGEVRAGIFGDATFCGRGPAAQVDAFDAHALDHDGLSGRVWAEGGD